MTGVMMTLDDCLPQELRGPATTITKIAAGLSGAGVYRVEAADGVCVLKVSDPSEPLGAWRARVDIQRSAGDAGLAPRVVHTDEARRAVVTTFVMDQSMMPLYFNPATRAATLAQMGRTLRRVHELPLPAGAPWRDPRDFLAESWSALESVALPAFARAAVQRVLDEDAPTRDRPLVLSHNDVNPSNVIYDGEKILLLDWDAAGPNDPLYDLATLSVFLRMDGDACRTMLSAHDDEEIAELPARFAYLRRVVAVLLGTMFFTITRRNGTPATPNVETLDTTPALADFYQLLRTGAVQLGSSEGQRQFALAMMKESFTL